MNKLLLTLCLLPSLASANEQYSQVWNFATPDQTTVGLNQLQLFCTANKSKCPAGMTSGFGNGAGNGSGSLFTPSTSSSANQISIVVAGDGNSVTLTSDQESDGNTIQSEQENNVTIDYDNVLNIENK